MLLKIGKNQVKKRMKIRVPNALEREKEKKRKVQ